MTTERPTTDPRIVAKAKRYGWRIAECGCVYTARGVIRCQTHEQEA